MTFKNNPLFRFLSSLKLAVFLIVVLALVLATGTIVESRYTAAVAKRYVYGTGWFSIILLFLVLNVMASALSRWPWKKYHTGFVTTHAGIILILLGSLITQTTGLDGQMALAEGEVGATVQENKPFLYYQWAHGPEEKVPAQFRFRNPSPDHPVLIHLDGGGFLSFDGYLENSEKVLSAAPAKAGGDSWPAVHVRLKSSFVDQDTWLFLGNPEHSRLDLGPAQLYFVEDQNFNRILQAVERNGLVLGRAKDGSLRFQTKFKGELQPLQKVEKPGVPYPTGWIDMDLTVLESKPAAVPSEDYRPLAFARGQDPVPAVRYKLDRPPESLEGWIPWQGQSNLVLDGKPFVLAYGPEQLHLPFALRLKKFKMGFDPGTQKAASYASDVKLVDPEKNVDRDVTISMNEPLQHRGFTIYQASYSPNGDGTFVSVFSVARDPGIILKYGGSIVLILGILLMYTWRKSPSVKQMQTVATPAEPTGRG